MTIFKNLKISTNNSISNSARKKIEKEIGFNIEKDAKIFKCKKINLLGEEGNIIAFNWSNKWILSLNYIRSHTENNYPTIYIDIGAKEPIKRGCDIFKPGVNMHKERITQEFKKNDIVNVEILNYGIFAIAEALIGFEDLNDEKGIGFKVLTCEGDELDTLNI